ncbi:Trk system potassium uptake protein TrkH [Sporomusa carbonis]
MHPEIVVSMSVGGEAIEPTVLNAVSYAVFLFIMFIFTTTVLLLTLNGFEPFDAMGAAAATLGNVGPGFGPVGPTTIYAEVSTFAKLILMLSMLLGRLELFTLLVFVRPEFWRSQRNW